ncbi:MAG: hypothetical protein ABH808_03330, partial [Candidatus Kuenenbacteria bacterium]
TLTNIATSSTASIAKTGLDIQSTGTWTGTSAVNTGLNVNVSGGTTNYAAIFQGGNVGIGTTSPGAKLDVNGNANASMYYDRDDTNYYIDPARNVTTYSAVLKGYVGINPFGTSPGNTGEIRFSELVANGSSFAGFKSPDSLAGDNIYSLPTTYPTATGQALTSTTTGIMSWATTMTNPMNAIGDIIYGGTSGAPTRLAGTAGFLKSTGAVAPSWSAIQSADLPGSFSGFANPSANIGTTVVNGSATTAMRSDAAPALSQTIVPTWTGTHTFSNSTYSALFTGGNVGIGVTTPGAKLDVNGSINAKMFYDKDDTDYYIDPAANIAYSAVFKKNVGIGTTSPGALLNLKGNLNTALTGTVSVPASSSAVTGSGTSFTTELIVDDSIKINSEIFTVLVITDNTHLTLSSNHVAGASNIIAYKDSDLFIVQNGNGNEKFKMNKSGDVTINKLNVTTIDPLYEIKKKKYATYVSSIVGGVNEEYIGKAKLKTQNL